MKLFITCFISAAIGCVVLLTACQQTTELTNIDEIKYDAGYAIPLVKAKFSLNDFIQARLDTTIDLIIREDGLLSLVYRSDVAEGRSETLLKELQAQLPPVFPMSSPRTAFPLDLGNGLAVKKLFLKTGKLGYFIQNPNPEPLDVVITLANFKKDGVVLEYKTKLSGYSGNGVLPTSSNAFSPTNIAGYTLEAINDSLVLQYKATKPNGEQAILQNVLFQLSDATISYVEGSLGRSVFEAASDQLYLDAFETIEPYTLIFDDLSINLYVENSFGLPTRAIVDELKTSNKFGDVKTVTGTFSQSGFDLPYPALNEVGKVKRDTFVIDRRNSTIAEASAISPLYVDYSLSTLINPDNVLGLTGFITDSSYYKVDVEVLFPFIGKSTGYYYEEKFPVNLPQIDGIYAADFKVFTTNEIPLDIEIQGYFQDENGVVIDSLFTKPQVVFASQKAAETITKLDEKRYTNLRKASSILIGTRTTSSGGGNQSIQILSSQGLDIRIGAILRKRNQ